MPPRPDCRISARPGRVARCSAASNSRPVAADSSCRWFAAAGSAGTDRRSRSGRCCSPSTSRTATMSTRTRSSHARSGCGKAPRDGAYPPVRPGCSPRPCLCTRCRRCSSPDGDACHCRQGHRSSSAAAEAAVVAASCYARCRSCIGTG